MRIRPTFVSRRPFTSTRPLCGPGRAFPCVLRGLCVQTIVFFVFFVRFVRFVYFVYFVIFVISLDAVTAETEG
jgi:hypothetical protein